MNTGKFVELAKLGDPEAIATLMSQALTAHGVTVTAKLEQGCLEVALAGVSTPDQRQCLHIIRQGLIRLEASSIRTVKVYGIKANENYPQWMEVFSLDITDHSQSLRKQAIDGTENAATLTKKDKVYESNKPLFLTSDDVSVRLETYAEELLQKYQKGMRNFTGVKLIQVSLIDAILNDIILEETDLSRAVLRRVKMQGAILKNANLSGANLIEADLTEADLTGTNFSSMKLGGQTINNLVGSAVPISTNLKKAILLRANLTNADLSRATLEEAILDQANLTNAMLVRTNGKRCSFVYCTLNRANLSWGTFDEANFSNANLSRANLRRGSFVGADLSQANLWYTDLTEANLSRAKLTGANLTGANLTGTQMPDGRTMIDKRYRT